jgi:phage-related tail fiber protein
VVDNLILERHDGSTIDTGNVRGPTGSTGAAGATGPAGQNAAFKVKAATTANITLSGAQTIDGISIVATDRVLVQAQSTPAQNGIYVAAAGAWSRATDADTSAEISSSIVQVQSGTANGGLRFITNFKVTDTIGTTAMSWLRLWDGASAVWISFSGTTDASGLLTITHGLPFTPSDILIMNRNPAANFPVVWGVDTVGATTFRARFMNGSTGGAAVSIATGPQKALCFR